MAWDDWGLLIVHDWNVQKPIPGYMSIVLTAPPGCISSHNSKIAKTVSAKGLKLLTIEEFALVCLVYLSPLFMLNLLVPVCFESIDSYS